MTASAAHDPGAPVTLESVAAHAGVSRQTVSNALNAPGKLRAETLHRVQESIAVLGYRPNRSARSLRTRSAGLLGCAVGPTSERFLPALCAAASVSGRDVLVFTVAASDPLGGYDDLLARGAVDGFVLPDVAPGDRRPGWLARRRVPFVSVGRSGGAQPGPWVDIDGAAGLDAAVRHLHRRGHRRIAALGWASGVGESRLAGWVDAVRELGLPGSDDLVARTVDSLDAGRRATDRLLDSSARPTAVAAVSDVLALGALRAIAGRGLVPGVDVAVTGYGDTALAAVPTGGLTSLREPVEETARHAIRVLDAAALDGAPGSVLLPPALVVRGSSSGVR